MGPSGGSGHRHSPLEGTLGPKDVRSGLSRGVVGSWGVGMHVDQLCCSPAPRAAADPVSTGSLALALLPACPNPGSGSTGSLPLVLLRACWALPGQEDCVPQTHMLKALPSI